MQGQRKIQAVFDYLKTEIDETYDAERSLLILTDIVCYMKQETKCAFDRRGIKK